MRTNDLERRFVLDEKQIRRVDAWMKDHPCKLRGRDSGAIGGRYTYTFTPTSIGVLAGVKCACGARESLTDPWDL